MALSQLATLIPTIALREVGTVEVNGSNCGLRVNEYKASTVLDPKEPWAWCAAFVCWVVEKAMAAAGHPFTFARPTTPGAWALADWSRKQDNSTQTKDAPNRDVQGGDVLGYTFSHCGIALGPPDADGYVPTVEGNTDSAGSREGGGVFRKTRHISKIRFRIRFTV